MQSTGPFPAVLRAPEVKRSPRLIIYYAGHVAFPRKPSLFIYPWFTDKLDYENNNAHLFLGKFGSHLKKS